MNCSVNFIRARVIRQQETVGAQAVETSALEDFEEQPVIYVYNLLCLKRGK